MTNNIKMNGKSYKILDRWLLRSLYFNNIGVEIFMTEENRVIMIKKHIEKGLSKSRDIVSFDFYEENFSENCGPNSLSIVQKALEFLETNGGERK